MMGLDRIHSIHSGFAGSSATSSKAMNARGTADRYQWRWAAPSFNQSVVPSGTMDLQVSANHSEGAARSPGVSDPLTVNGRFIKTIEATADVAAVVEM